MPAAIQNELLAKLKELSDQATADTGIEIAEVQLRGAGNNKLLRLYIDKPGGITHGDCEIVSARVSELLDVQDAMPDEGYTLEVSSLGSDRKFNGLRDYERVMGQKVAVTLRAPQDGQARLEGKVVGVREGSVELDIAGQVVPVLLENVAKAKLKFEP